MRVLIAEDEQALGMFLMRGMKTEGHEITLARDGEEVLQKVEEVAPDLLILDLNLPKRDGMDVLRMVRAWRNDLPIIVLTRRADIETRVACFDMGADDFMPKPFSLRELRARCRALLRRRKQATSSVLRCGALELNRLEHTVCREGEAISLTNKEFALLECLMANRGRCVSRTTLLAQVWQTQRDANTNVVDVYVNYLRRKLNKKKEQLFIQTVRGIGYMIAGSDLDRVSSTDLTVVEFRPDAAMPLTTPPWGTYGNRLGA